MIILDMHVVGVFEGLFGRAPRYRLIARGALGNDIFIGK